MDKKLAINKLLKLGDYKTDLKKYQNELKEMALYNAINLRYEKVSQTNKIYSVVENCITKKAELTEKIEKLKNDINEIESKLNNLDDIEKKLLYTRYVEDNGLTTTAYLCNYEYTYTCHKINSALQKFTKLFFN